MRIMLFTICLAILVIGFSWCCLGYLQSSSSALLGQLDNLERQISHEQWQDAQQSFAVIMSYWTDIHKNWKFLIDHREIDEIEITIARLKSAFESKEQSNALAELSVLKFYLRHIPAKEQVLLRNIF